MKKRNPPTIAITGSFQELVEIECLLYLLGYNNKEKIWNDKFTRWSNDKEEDMCIISYSRNKSINYFSKTVGIKDIEYIFKSNEIEKVIEFVENYK